MTTKMDDDNEYITLDLDALYGKLTVADLFTSHREGEGLSQAELARMLGISRQRLCDYEKGRRLPSPSHAYAYAQILNIHPGLMVQMVIQEWLEEAKIPLKVSLAA